ncbi:two-component sensor histidine kinase [Rhizobium sp. BE258]|nr:two-component sensor histidine kinase [Rhizobium sp. BE258]
MDAGRISFDGPDVVLSADVALPLSLVIHELATNAIKYGSLGVDQGTVVITWTAKNGRIDLQ